MAVRGCCEVFRSQRRNCVFSEARERQDRRKRSRIQARNVVPAEDRMPIVGKACMTLPQSGLAVRCAIEPPAIDTVADDQIEKSVRKMLAQLL